MENIALSRARQGFKFSNQTENLSVNTLIFYEKNMRIFAEWFKMRASNPGFDPQLGSITADDVRQFIGYLQTKPTMYDDHQFRQQEQKRLSPASVRGIVATLSAFFNWAKSEELIDRNPMDKVHKPKVPKTIKERFSEGDIQKLLEACKQDTPSLASRNRAVILFLLDTGVRAAELCSLSLENLDLEHGRAHVTGKGMKDRDVFLGKTTRKVLWNYVAVHRVSGASDFVFQTIAGDKIVPSRLAKILRNVGRRAGVANVHPHRFRHTAARLFLRNGGNAFALQALLGHEEITTTKRYVEMEREDLEQAHEHASPVDRMQL